MPAVSIASLYSHTFPRETILLLLSASSAHDERRIDMIHGRLLQITGNGKKPPPPDVDDESPIVGQEYYTRHFEIVMAAKGYCWVSGC
jgi:hypothetical protein